MAPTIAHPIAMPSQTFTSGRIRRADWDSASQRLDIHWADKTVQAYLQVPQEVFRRLCQAPNPASYWEDRIADEYPRSTASRPSGSADAAERFKDLFGDG